MCALGFAAWCKSVGFGWLICLVVSVGLAQYRFAHVSVNWIVGVDCLVGLVFLVCFGLMLLWVCGLSGLLRWVADLRVGRFC